MHCYWWHCTDGQISHQWWYDSKQCSSHKWKGTGTPSAEGARIEAPRGVGSGEGVTPSPVTSGEGSGRGLRLYALVVSICLSVCRKMRTQNAIFSKWFLLTDLQEVPHGLFKQIIGHLKLKMADIPHLENCEIAVYQRTVFKACRLTGGIMFSTGPLFVRSSVTNTTNTIFWIRINQFQHKFAYVTHWARARNDQLPRLRGQRSRSQEFEISFECLAEASA